MEPTMVHKKRTKAILRWVRCRFRWTRNHSRQLDAHDYGREYWVFPIWQKAT